MASPSVKAHSVQILGVNQVEPKEQIVLTIGNERSVDALRRDGTWLYLDEVSHRILNEYTIMLSVVRLALMKVADAGSRGALDDIASRLTASATTFRSLSPPSDYLPRDLDEALGSLCASLSASLLAERGIRLTLSTEPVHVSATTCWKASLITCELVTNAVRHAFPEAGNGSIVVKLSKQAGMIRCAVIDNGSAPSPIVPGRGSAVLASIAAELGGTIVRKHTGSGSAVVLHLPECELPVRGTGF